MQLILKNPEQAHHVINRIWNDVKIKLLAGHSQVIEVRDAEDAMTDKQRRYYHGYILTEIAKQAEVNGQKFAMPIWKEFFREKYLGKKRVKTLNPITGKKSYRFERQSTEALGVKAYNVLIERVTAFAATELGVNFYQDFDEWVQSQEDM